jgi:serine/threonine protein kinase
MAIDWAAYEGRRNSTETLKRPSFSAIPITRFGKYNLIGKLGQGGMAEVFLAYVSGPAGFRKLTVIKRLHDHLLDEPGFIGMFLDEARLAARLNHPNVVQTYEVGEVDGQIFLAMEYLDGQPLDRVRKRSATQNVTPPPLIAARIVSEALDGLSYAHQLTDYDGTPLNVIHRDISPHNVFVTYEGMVKILDFGIAKTSYHVSETQAGTVKGKLAYIAPEQGRGHPIDQRVDLWSMGVVLWETLANRRLFKGPNDRATLAAALLGPIPDLREAADDIPEPLIRICRKALFRDPSRRYQTALEMKGDIEAYLNEDRTINLRKEVSAYLRDLFSDLIVQNQEVLRRCLSDSVQGVGDGHESLLRSKKVETPSGIRLTTGGRSSQRTPSAPNPSVSPHSLGPGTTPSGSGLPPKRPGTTPIGGATAPPEVGDSTPSAVSRSATPSPGGQGGGVLSSPEHRFQSSLWSPEPQNERSSPSHRLLTGFQAPSTGPRTPASGSGIIPEPDQDDDDLTPTSARHGLDEIAPDREADEDHEEIFDVDEIPPPPPPNAGSGSFQPQGLLNPSSPLSPAHRPVITPGRVAVATVLLVILGISTCLVARWSSPSNDVVAPIQTLSPISADDPRTPSNDVVEEPVTAPAPPEVATVIDDTGEIAVPRGPVDGPPAKQPETVVRAPRSGGAGAKSPVTSRPRGPRLEPRPDPTIPAAVATPRNETTEPRPPTPADDQTGFLSLDTIPWSRVSLGGRDLGTTPLLRARLPVGTHVLTLTNPEAGITTTYRVTIQPGETTARRLGLE